MNSIKLDYLGRANIIEDYYQYLINDKEVIPTRADMYLKIVRMLQNYIGKSFVDIEENDILCFLYYLQKRENYTERTIEKYLAGIKKFYKYLWIKGDINKLPFKKINKKNLKNLIAYRIIRKINKLSKK